MAWPASVRHLWEGPHRRARRNLSAYLDGDLVPAEEAWMERHLGECSACREELEGLQETLRLLRELPRVPLPRTFVLREVPAPRGVWPWLSYQWVWTSLKGATVAAAVLLAVFLSLDLASQGLPSAPPWAGREAPGEVTGAIAELPFTPSPVPAFRGVTALAQAPSTPEIVPRATVVAERVVEKVVTQVVEKPVEKVIKETVVLEKPRGLAPAPALGISPTPAAVEAGSVTADIAPTAAPATAEAKRVETATPTATTAVTPTISKLKEEPIQEAVVESPPARGRPWRWLEGAVFAILLALGGFLWAARRERHRLGL